MLEIGKPVLGICYGLHFMVHALGGKVRPGSQARIWARDRGENADSQLLEGLPKVLAVWMSHGDEAEQLPEGFTDGTSPSALAGIQNPDKRMWAVQFHPEVHHTKLGADILRNFVFKICGAKADWTPQHLYRCNRIFGSSASGLGRAICALSGGVDSSVAAVLVDRAMRDSQGKSRLTCVFVNNGVLRKDEFQKVQNTLRDKLGLHLIAVDASYTLSRQVEGRDRS